MSDRVFRVGDAAELTVVVGPGHTIALGDRSDATVFSTPAMINLMEHAAREVLRLHLGRGEESVGIDVKIKHSSATPPRAKVTARATITSIDNNVIGFDVVATDPWGEIGRGTHRRAVIRTDGFASRLAQEKPTRAASDPQGPLPELDTIDVRAEGRLMRVTLNRPHKRNAVNSTMTGDMERLAGWLEASADAVGVVVLSGAGDVFCAGDDLTDLYFDDPQACESLSQRRGELYEAITRLPQVFIAEIDGVALGGGFVCACACDFRVATHQAKLGLPEVTLGWPPNYGLSIIESLIGRGRTMELALTANPITAREAESMGLLHQVVPTGQLRSASEAMAQKLLALPPTAVAAMKQLFGIGGPGFDNQQATNAFMKCLKSPDAAESIARFSRR